MTPLAAQLTLLRLPSVGTSTYWQLLQHLGRPADILQLPARALSPYLNDSALEALSALHRDAKHPINQAVARDLAWLGEHPEVQVLTPGDSGYPALLAGIAIPPPLLFVRGNPDVLELPQLAIVGSRHPTAGGRENTRKFAQFLARGGFAVTSGLALGVDASAHRGALDAGGITVAVMGTGIDRLYPARHRTLADDILAGGGALVSEVPLGVGPQAGNFPRRNRIISGLSLGTLVTEAAVRSGSLITADCALKQQREVFAIPGSIHNPMAHGCHALIRRGAKLVECADDILEELGGALAYKSEQLEQSGHHPEALDTSERQVMAALGYDPVTADTLCERCALDAGQLMGVLMALEIKGLVVQSGSVFNRV